MTTTKKKMMMMMVMMDNVTDLELPPFWYCFVPLVDYSTAVVVDVVVAAIEKSVVAVRVWWGG